MDKKKCKKCEFYDKENDCCKFERNNCGDKTDFSKCNDYLISEKLVMY